MGWLGTDGRGKSQRLGLKQSSHVDEGEWSDGELVEEFGEEQTLQDSIPLVSDFVVRP